MNDPESARSSYLGWVRVELSDVTLEERTWFFETLGREAHELCIGELSAAIIRVEPDPTLDESREALRVRDERMRYRGD